MAIIALALAAPASSGELEDVAETLVIIESPDWRERTSTRKRFIYLIPRIVENCADITSPTHAGDVSAFVYGQLMDVGINDGMLGTTENLHRMASALKSRNGEPVKCLDLYAMFTILRQDGTPAEEARNSVVQIVSKLFKL